MQPSPATVLYPEIRPTALNGDRTTRRLLYLYLVLLVFEGALRKWFLPGLSQPLILIRDPIALLIILNHTVIGRSVLNIYTLPILITGALSFLATLVVGHGSLMVATYGFRTLALHFLLIFVMSEVFTRRDVEKVGKWLMVAAIPAALLIALQFYSPQSAWVNRGVGGDLSGAGFSGAMGFMRPSGYFSFSNGNTLFFGLVAAFVGYFWTSRDRCSTILLFAATACVLIVLPLSISRSYFIRVGLTLVCLLIASLRSGRAFVSLLVPIIMLPIVVAILSQFEFMQTAIGVMTSRFETASQSEGALSESIISRIFGPIGDAISGDGHGSTPLLGHGLGLGTNVGSFLISGRRFFIIAEGEWPRIIGEMGFLLGFIVLIVRVLVAVQMGFRSLAATRVGNALPLLLLSSSFSLLLIGGWAQPTSLGFCVAATGLTLGSLRDE